MAEPVLSRQAIRRRIGQKLRMQFYLRYGGEALQVSSGAASSILIPVENLTQDSSFWNRNFLYLITADTERRITGFSSGSTGGLVPEWDLAAAPSTAETIEITSTWPPSQIHQAINQAIEEGGQVFPNAYQNQTLGLAEDLFEYNLSSLSPAPYRLLQVYAERSQTYRTYQVTAAGATSISSTSFSSSDFGSSNTPDTNWLVSVYRNLGRGQVRGVRVISTAGKIDLDNSTVYGADSWATTPDTTSFFVLWNPLDQLTIPDRIPNARVDAKDYPNTLYLPGNFPTSYGLRLILIYLARPGALTVDTAETELPEGYVLNRAISFLHESLINDDRYDRAMHAQLADGFLNAAKTYARENPRRIPSGTLWQPQRGGISSIGSTGGDPLGWAD